MLDLHCTAAAGLEFFNATNIRISYTVCCFKGFLFHYSKLPGNDFYIVYLTLFSSVSNPIWQVSFVIGLGHKRFEFILCCQICLL